MKQIVKTHEIPIDESYLNLPTFICLQHARTELSKIRVEESTKLLSDEIVESLTGSSNNAEITFPKLYLEKMKFALQSVPLLADLVPALLINNTKENFVFSDNPVVFHNTYFNKLKNIGNQGLQSPGLQIFCPLNDKVMLMLYDPKFYSVNIKQNHTLEINTDVDIQSINILQFLNCNNSVFYSDSSQENKIKDIHKKNEHLTGKKKMVMQNMQLTEQDGSQRDLLHLYEERPDYDLKLSFVKLNNVEGDFKIVRNPEMVNKIKKDIDEYDKSYSSKSYRVIYKTIFQTYKISPKIWFS